MTRPATVSLESSERNAARNFAVLLAAIFLAGFGMYDMRGLVLPLTMFRKRSRCLCRPENELVA